MKITKATICATLVILLGTAHHQPKEPRVNFTAPPGSIQLSGPAPPILELPK